MERSRRTAGLLVAFMGLVAVALVLAVASWVAEADSAVVGEPTTGSPTARFTPAASPTPGPSPTTSPTGKGTVRLAFGGDVHFERFIGTALAADPVNLLAATRPLFAGADHVVVNLETAVSERGTKWPKSFNFRAQPSAYSALLAAGVDAVSLANNHTLDYREEAFADTLQHAADAGMATFGAGPNLTSALAPHSVTINGHRIAFLGAAEVLTDESWVARDASADAPARPGMPGGKAHHLDHLLPAIGAAAQTHDVVVVYMHWGNDYTHCPGSREQDLAPKLIAAGATIVVGAHQHEVQGYGFVDGGLVHYGLGNFVWWTRGNEGARSETGVFHVTIAPNGTMTPEWRPAEITDGIPAPVPEADVPAYLSRMEDYIDCAGFDSDR